MQQQQQQSSQQQQQQQPGSGARRNSRCGAGLSASSLSAINEGDEHVTLMDVLGTRDGPLSEEELWAVCREGCLAVRALGDASEALQSLCLSPDTLAFDAHGSIRLLSQDPENGSADITCQPPEFYQFGNSYKGHVYSLGSAMLMAAHYNVPDGGKTRHSRRLSDLLADMTEGDYEARADLERVLAECDAHMRGRSSNEACRAIVASVRRGDDSATMPGAGDVSQAARSIYYEASNTSRNEGFGSASATAALPSADSAAARGTAAWGVSDGALLAAAIPAAVGTKRERRGGEQPDGADEPQAAPKTSLSADSSAGQISKVARTASPPSPKAIRLVSSGRTLAEIRNSGGTSAFCQAGSGDSVSGKMGPRYDSGLQPQQSTAAVTPPSKQDGVLAPLSSRGLPAAYSSSATHFTPIILTQQDGDGEEAPQPPPPPPGGDHGKLTAKKIKELKKKLLKNRQLAEVSGASKADAGLAKTSASEDVGSAAPTHSAAAAAASKTQSPPARPPAQAATSPTSAQASVGDAASPTRTVRSPDSTSSSDATTLADAPEAHKQASAVSSPSATASTSPLQPGAVPSAQPLSAAGIPYLIHPATTLTYSRALPDSGQQQPQSIMTQFSASVPFVVQQDPSSGALQLVPLYPGLGSAVFLPPAPVVTALAASSAAMATSPNIRDGAGGPATAAAARPTQSGAASVTTAPPGLGSPTGGDSGSYSPLSPEAAGLRDGSKGVLGGGRDSSPPAPPSPSFSKDSGVGSVSHYSGDPQLIERLLASSSVRHNQLLGRLIKLIRDEFAFDGYLDNGVEDLAMAEYTASLAGLRWDTFSSAITEKYCDLYWEEDLLAQLFEAINGKLPPTASLTPASDGTRRAKPAGAGGASLHKAAAPSSGGCGYSPFRPISAGVERDAAAAGAATTTTLGAVQQAGVTAAKEQSAAGLLRPAARRSPPRRRSSSLTRSTAAGGGGAASDTTGDTSGPMASRQRGGSGGGAAQQPSLVKGRSASVQDLLSSPREERTIGRSFSQSALDRPSVPLRKTDSRVSLNLLGTGLLVSGLSGSMPVIRVHGQGTPANDFSSATPVARRSADRSARYTPRSSKRASPSRDLGSSASRCSDDSGSTAARLSLRPSSGLSDPQGSTATAGGSEAERTRLIDVVYYTSTLTRRLDERFRQAIDKADSVTRTELLKRLQDTDQQLAVHRKRRAKTLKYCRRLPDTVQQGKVAYDQKAVLDRALVDLNEANDQLDFLVNVKRHLEMLAAEHSSLADNLIYSLAKGGPGERLLLSAAPENPLLQFKSRVDGLSRRGAKVLHAGTALGLMANLFARGCFSQQYAHHFFYCYRYFATPSQLLNLIAAKYESATLEAEHKDERVKVASRALDLLQAWLEGYYSVDFKHDASLQDAFTAFLQDSVAQHDPPRAESLFQLLEDLSAGRKNDLTHVSAALRDDIDVALMLGDREWQQAAKATGARTAPGARGGGGGEEAPPSLLVLPNAPAAMAASPTAAPSPASGIRKKLSFKLNPGSGKPNMVYKKGRSGIISCVRNADDPYRDREPYHAACARKTEAFSLFDYSSQTIAEQLTLIEQTFFERCHPVHFMNSRAQGIAASLASLSHSATPRGCVWDEAAAGSSGGSLFVGSYAHDAAIQCMIEHSQSLSYWVAAELVSCNSVKSQLTLLTKFIFVAKICKEIRNYATCVAVVDGLENLIVRQLPAWKDIPAKSIEELKNVKVFLSSDAMCLTDHDDASSSPTLPSILLFVLHIQQLEQGAFTLANGMYKWSKMKNIAKAVDQIRLFKQRCYEFQPRSELCDDLIGRMKDLCQYDLQILAASRDVNFQKTSSGKWATAIRKLKGAFGSSSTT